MISSATVTSNLQLVEQLYQSASAQPVVPQLMSKLAILELCGWIEEAMDDIVKSCAQRTLKQVDHVKFVEGNVIKPTYGFEYNAHFRKMLTHVIGFKGIEDLETAADPSKFAPMVAHLCTLKSVRDSLAHTHAKGTAQSLDAPTVTISRLRLVEAGLSEVDRALRRLGF